MNKLFDGIVRLEIENNDTVMGMYSKEKELCKFSKIVRITGTIESWLLKVQDEMKSTLAKALRESNKCYDLEPRK